MQVLFRAVTIGLLSMIGLWPVGVSHAQALQPLQAVANNHCVTSVAILPPAGLMASSVVPYPLWTSLNQHWNAQLTNQAKIIKSQIARPGFYDIKITLPRVAFTPAPFEANGNPNRCRFSANPATKKLQIIYRAVGNEMKGRAVKDWWPDPEVSGTFDLVVVMSFDTTGTGGNPMVLQRSEVRVANFRYTGSSHLEAQQHVIGFSTRIFQDSGAGAGVAIDANRFFRNMSGSQVIGSVRPGTRNNMNFFDVRRPSPGINLTPINQR